MNAQTKITPPQDLPTLTARAYAAQLRLNDYARLSTADEAEFGKLEAAWEETSRAVRAKLAEIGVDPRILTAVLS